MKEINSKRFFKIQNEKWFDFKHKNWLETEKYILMIYN